MPTSPCSGSPPAPAPSLAAPRAGAARRGGVLPPARLGLSLHRGSPGACWGVPAAASARLGHTSLWEGPASAGRWAGGSRGPGPRRRHPGLGAPRREGRSFPAPRAQPSWLQRGSQSPSLGPGPLLHPQPTPLPGAPPARATKAARGHRRLDGAPTHRPPPPAPRHACPGCAALWVPSLWAGLSPPQAGTECPRAGTCGLCPSPPAWQHLQGLLQPPRFDDSMVLCLQQHQLQGNVSRVAVGETRKPQGAPVNPLAPSPCKHRAWPVPGGSTWPLALLNLLRVTRSQRSSRAGSLGRSPLPSAVSAAPQLGATRPPAAGASAPLSAARGKLSDHSGAGRDPRGPPRVAGSPSPEEPPAVPASSRQPPPALTGRPGAPSLSGGGTRALAGRVQGGDTRRSAPLCCRRRSLVAGAARGGCGRTPRQGSWSEILRAVSSRLVGGFYNLPGTQRC